MYPLNLMKFSENSVRVTNFLFSENFTSIKKELKMAKTQDGKKIVPVDGYTKNDGTKVKPHRRSTPN